MTFAAVESDLRFLFLNLSGEAHSAVIWAAVLLYYSCLIVLTEGVLQRAFGRPVRWRRSFGGAGRRFFLEPGVHPQELRLRRMVMNDAATARRLMALEVTRGAPSWAAAAEWAADRLVRERS
ncbi:hypothetical protein M3484_16470 [Pseudomonas sp. GX19020]|uniref:hypothetical protein n=1 Tax=Pseudomonas sp. GX19020 TaxID=2942277 RepID=UPI002019B119|nr:hypothetical protein [Pseudomonas sp. GX19020]MCL4068167.1 hypothetical protein [Pseudomonas sp. GX19020]